MGKHGHENKLSRLPFPFLSHNTYAYLPIYNTVRMEAEADGIIQNPFPVLYLPTIPRYIRYVLFLSAKGRARPKPEQRLDSARSRVADVLSHHRQVGM